MKFSKVHRRVLLLAAPTYAVRVRNGIDASISESVMLSIRWETLVLSVHSPAEAKTLLQPLPPTLYLVKLMKRVTG